MAKPLEDLFDLVNSQKYSEAIIHLKEFIKKDKDNWNAWHLLGQAYRYLDDLENAIACHEKAYSIKKDHPAVLLALGIAYQLNKNYIGAIKALEEAIRIDKHYTLAYNSLALTYKRLDTLDKSIETYINGMNTIAIKFCLTLENLKTNKIYKQFKKDNSKSEITSTDFKSCIQSFISIDDIIQSKTKGGELEIKNISFIVSV